MGLLLLFCFSHSLFLNCLVIFWLNSIYQEWNIVEAGFPPSREDSPNPSAISGGADHLNPIGLNWPWLVSNLCKAQITSALSSLLGYRPPAVSTDSLGCFLRSPSLIGPRPQFSTFQHHRLSKTLPCLSASILVQLYQQSHQKENCCPDLDSFFWVSLLSGISVLQVLAISAATNFIFCIPGSRRLPTALLPSPLGSHFQAFWSLALYQESPNAHRGEAMRRKLGSTQWASVLSSISLFTSDAWAAIRHLCFKSLSAFLVVLGGSTDLLQATSSQPETEVIK